MNQITLGVNLSISCKFVCRFHHQALVELKILDVIKRKDKDNLHNVIHMKEYFYFRNHLCISFELLGLVCYLHSESRNVNTLNNEAFNRGDLPSVTLPRYNSTV